MVSMASAAVPLPVYTFGGSTCCERLNGLCGRAAAGDKRVPSEVRSQVSMASAAVPLPDAYVADSQYRVPESQWPLRPCRCRVCDASGCRQADVSMASAAVPLPGHDWYRQAKYAMSQWPLRPCRCRKFTLTDTSAASQSQWPLRPCRCRVEGKCGGLWLCLNGLCGRAAAGYFLSAYPEEIKVSMASAAVPLPDALEQYALNILSQWPLRPCRCRGLR